MRAAADGGWAEGFRWIAVEMEEGTPERVHCQARIVGGTEDEAVILGGCVV